MRASPKGLLMKDQFTIYVFVAVIFIVGIVFGALLVNALTLDQQQDLAGYVQKFAERAEKGLLPDGALSFWDRVFFHGKWLLLVWVLGLTVVGMPLVLALDFLKGVLVGFTVGTLVSQYSWKGLLFSLVSVAPPNLLVVPALLIASVSALSFSLYIVRNRLMGRYGTLSEPFLAHTGTFGLMLIMIAAAASIETFVSPAMLKWAVPLLSEVAGGL
ncbi:stage II sporulation protein M [Paenibacillus oenotherae]|uniref:Stage II sporulation protein M n=1 Tax=Paenibacillus oenotherae TaxID=1435645 RepID=A0ABS7D0W3_9BACL|nr:stage II sporulation protein M [Paenibacillus oenotherae]MBW7473523.1 stage II sporulation protein M [Paenibacillus oenotherae]